MAFNFFGNKKITEKLYEQNLELAVKNKTLSLLERLYHTSTLTLTPEEMAQAITNIIQKDLNLEWAAVLQVEKESKSLKPLAFSGSKRLMQIFNALNLSFYTIVISDTSKSIFLSHLLEGKNQYITHQLSDIWGGDVDQDKLLTIQKDSNFKTALLNSLVIGKEVIGVLVLGFNRDYETLSAFEKESIKSFVDPISLLLYKAYLYANIQRAYAVEKKAKEEIEKIDKFKDQFLMVTQHNLRTPLTSMIGYTDLLLKGFFGKQNKKTTEVLHKFQALTQGMIRMVNNFLDMAQFQLGKGVVNFTLGVDVLTLVDEIVQELQFKAESKKIYVKLEKPEKIFTIAADREKLKAAIFNIIDNAVKYTEKEGVNISIKNQVSSIKNIDSVLIEVRDTGIGIAKEKLATMFEQMFERSEEAKKVASLGSGVGLYLSGEIIKAHHGKVWVESEGIGKGSTFYVELPLSTNN